MRALVQRVSQASVRVGDETISRIGPGLVVLLGISSNDGADHVDYMIGKISTLRIFEDEKDEQRRMNLSLIDVGGAMLVVSQFTLLGDVRKGRRPSFVGAAEPQMAQRLYEDFVAGVRRRGIAVETGRFGDHMAVELTNDGPVTIWIDSDDVATLGGGAD